MKNKNKNKEKNGTAFTKLQTIKKIRIWKGATPPFNTCIPIHPKMFL